MRLLSILFLTKCSVFYLYQYIFMESRYSGGQNCPRFDQWEAGPSSSFPDGSDGKESACNVGDLDSIPMLGRSPGEGKGYPLQYSCLENPHGHRSLTGYSPWGHRESGTTVTKQAHTGPSSCLCSFLCPPRSLSTSFF